MEPLLIFYEEPDADRWFPYDRYPRRILRRAVRGRPRPGGHARVFLNLRAGLDRIGVPYRVNDYAFARRHPDELVCIVGKPFVLDKIRWRNPILFGAAVFSHPLADPHLLERLPVARVLVPGEWMRRMFEPYYGDAVTAWPVGIDTARWAPAPRSAKTLDVLLYDKVMWSRSQNTRGLLDPVRTELQRRGLVFRELRYGCYREEEYEQLLRQARAMIFLCEHETQGIAYQQALSCDVPILAWDQGGFWLDPEYYPERVRHQPVTSVPYWDHRCGTRLCRVSELGEALSVFWSAVERQQFSPRQFILEHLTLEKCARSYVEIAGAVKRSMALAS